LVLFISIYSLVVNIGCANIVPPQGGPRDSIPPQLVRSTYPDSVLNFTGDRIIFFFNEFVEVQNIYEHLVVSPIPRVAPAVDYRLNTVTLRLKDPLEPNTTYSFNFGKAVKDFTEGNPLTNFTYTFSTGPYLDSLELRGRVTLAETGGIDTTLIVMLHTSPEDSAVVLQKPRYVAKLDRQGNFIFRNLPARTFYIYALKDEGGSLRYLNERQLFAFADKPVSLPADSVLVNLYAYSVKTETTRPVVTVPARIGKRKTDEPGDTRLRYQTSLADNHQDLLSSFFISFEQPLKIFDSTKLILSSDTTFNLASGYRFVLDSTRRRINLEFQLKENTTYNLIIDKDFAEDSLGRRLLRTDTLIFRTRSLGDYGSLKLRLKNIDLSHNPVLLMFKNDVLYKSYPLAGNELSEGVFLPGEYALRILYDENKNGQWDPGEFFKKRKQPELVKPIDRKINIKPNAPNEFEITL